MEATRLWVRSSELVGIPLGVRSAITVVEEDAGQDNGSTWPLGKYAQSAGAKTSRGNQLFFNHDSGWIELSDRTD
jgi:hypothetical protein